MNVSYALKGTQFYILFVLLLQVYLQHTRTVLDENQPEERQERVISINKHLDKLEQLSLDLNKCAPSLPVIPLPKIGNMLAFIRHPI